MRSPYIEALNVLTLKVEDSCNISLEHFVVLLNLDSSFNMISSRVSHNLIRCDAVLISNSPEERERRSP